MTRTYAFEDAFTDDWLPTIIARVAEELTARRAPSKWSSIKDETLVDAGKRQWERLKTERAAAGDESVATWTLPYLWEWGVDRYRLPLRRKIREMQCERMGLPPPKRKKRKAGDQRPPFAVPVTDDSPFWDVFEDAVTTEGRKKDAKFTDDVEFDELLATSLSSRIVDPALIESIASQLSEKSFEEVILPFLQARKSPGWRVEAVKNDALKKGRLRNSGLITRATRELSRILPWNAVFAPEESRFDVVRVSFGYQWRTASPYVFSFPSDLRPSRFKVFVALTDAIVIGIGFRKTMPYGDTFEEHFVHVRRGAALVVWATCATRFVSGPTRVNNDAFVLATEVALAPASPEDVRSKEPFFAVVE